MDALTTVADSLREAGLMFWETLWALVLGFGLSGVVQSMVERHGMQRLMGDRRPLTIARTSLLGAASSSCSYAASALARALFNRGADFTAAMVFMFASTNLVVELGIVLWLLVGWQFALAEFVGGAIMIVLLTAVLPRVVPVPTRAEDASALHAESAMVGAMPWLARVRSAGKWADAATYAIADLTMLRRELVIGFVVAGFLAVGVPTSFWSEVFVGGHGFATALENAIVGPFIALISFVCSIGNVPLAAALWHNGSRFGGVVAFVFADLISLPLVLIYRKFYGGRITLRLVVTFWLVMSAAGLAVEYLFDAAGLVPGSHSKDIVMSEWHWNYTTYLDFVAIALLAVMLWVAHNRQRFGGGEGYAIDPVCGMQVEVANAPAHTSYAGTVYYFCSDHCMHRFLTEPTRFAPQVAAV